MVSDMLTPLREDPPAMSAADALHRLEVMLACMDAWQTRRGETAQLMGAWAQWLRCITTPGKKRANGKECPVYPPCLPS